MVNLSKFIKKYIEKKFEQDPLWKDIQVIYSDQSIPGEGEHKILDFIRT